MNDEDEEVADEIARREKVKADRDNRKQRQDQGDDLEKEEKWKQMHMQIATSRASSYLTYDSDYVLLTNTKRGH